MKPPDTISSFCAFLFGLMGALFVLLSMLFVVTGVPVNGGPTWFLLPIGIIFLLTGQCSPWVVQCSYKYQGQTYIVRSGLFWAKPSFRHQQPAIYFDPHHPTRAYVDMVAIQREA